MRARAQRQSRSSRSCRNFHAPSILVSAEKQPQAADLEPPTGKMRFADTALVVKHADALALVFAATLVLLPSLNMTYARLEIHEDGEGKIEKFTIVKTGASYSGSGRGSDVKVNTAKRVEGRLSYNEPHFGDQLMMDLRFATDLAGIGAPVRF